MAVIQSSNFAKALYPGVNAWYGQAYNEYDKEWTKLFETSKSTRAWEEDVGTSGMGLFMQKNEGSPVEYDSERQAFTTRYTHVTYGLGFIITREMFEDNLYDTVGSRKAKALAMSLNQTKETIAANVYNRAFNSSYKGGDGVEIISASHPNLAGGTWSNILSTASDISEAALEQACIDISRFTNDRGLKIRVMPESLIITPDQEFDVTRILKSTGQVDVMNNNINALRALGKFPKGVIVNHYLTDTDAWFIRTNVSNGMKYFERRADEFTTTDDWDTENAKFKATFRCSFGNTDPRALYGSAGA
jgi:hypothetical protein